MRWFLRCSLLVAATSLLAAQSPPAPAEEPTPASLDEFKAAALRIVEQAGLPGAGLALVRANGIEWAGGVGVADRATGRPIDGDTLFRVGSVSKSFVAMALVQLYEDGQLDLDAPVVSIVPEVHIDNPWEATEPVRVRHLLEHTAGFDDMHFNEIYVLDDAPDRPLDEVLLRNPASRRVRWRPGTRMAYSNPGYAVAGRVIEAVAGKPYDSFIRERIFTPLAMTASTFSGDVEAPALAQGYERRNGPPVVRRRIHLRPAGALHSSPRELGLFVEMLLNWGELRGGYVIDPEYLSNMEWPRTTAASKAGVRAGYGLGIYSTIDMPYHVLGHEGGIDGFLSAYGYSPSRDVGYVVLLNGTYAPDALTRLSSLAIRYLKRDVAATPPDALPVAPDELRRFEGYYHDANPRAALLQAVEFPLGGRTVRVSNGRLVMTPVFGPDTPLVSVNDALFRRESELTASLAFTEVDGRPVLAGADIYAEKRLRWPVDLLRGVLAAALVCVALAPLIAAAGAWRRRARGGAGTGGLGTAWTLALLAFGAIFAVASTSPVTSLATSGGPSLVLFGASIVHPLVAFAMLPLTAAAWVRGLRGPIGWFAAATAAAHAGLACYLGWWGLIAFRSWTY
ncbi:MAG: beta-lactamase family protein [Acidobacteria bacterium]|nr:beta-lactamase family protein [Acidobacteriota bacterium]